jgi:serine/threonine-protein kinase
LGRGGMGEVYRAEDMKLRQTVALKFLPERHDHDEEWLNRLYHEVSNARRVSHRNVCRVYDVGEFEGQHFISMEYVRGEELESLLKRIGRLPEDKAVETARQLCAGLAAIHDKEILHRDLKPSNVILDERGNVRITDFGLAVVADEIRSRGVVAGTPAYMSPEQLEGRSLTTKSDIYSLGLVLYELFTGRRPFESSSLPELIRLRTRDNTPISLNSLVKNLDPVIETTVLRCLERDPDRRPASALQVAAALPGGDPLAAALAMGETPSPELVAAASKEGTLRPSVALTCVALIVVLTTVSLFLADRVKSNRLIPLGKSPEVLRERASEINRRLGYTQPPVDTAIGWLRSDFVPYIRANDSSPSRWDQLEQGQPAGILFWYRESPRYLVTNFLTNTRVETFDPEMDVSGMTMTYLDPDGRLYYFESVPTQVEDRPSTLRQLDWGALFVEAGLNINDFSATNPRWTGPSACDTRAAWTGTYPARPDIPIRIEAAAFHGLPVYFQVIEPWTVPIRMEASPARLDESIFQAIFVTFVLGALIVGGILAWRHIQTGIGDRKGAFRLSAVIVAAAVFRCIVRSSHVPTFGEFYVLWMTAMQALLLAGLFWLFYMSLEPLVRRWWPQRIISWSRLLAGGWRDPLVGRDILIGSLAGMIFPIGLFSSTVISKWLGLPPDLIWFNPQTLSGVRVALGEFALLNFALDIFFSLGFLFLFVIFYIFLRREWLATALVWTFLTVMLALGFGNSPVINFITAAICAALGVFVLRRFGFLAFTVMGTVPDVFLAFPMTTDSSAWYFDVTLLGVGILALLVIYAFHTSLGGQKLFDRTLIPE